MMSFVKFLLLMLALVQLRLQDYSATGLVFGGVNQNPCPPGFTYGGIAVSKCYAVVNQATNWQASQTKCRQLHPEAHLVVINSPLENQIISRILKNHECTIGQWNGWFWTGGQRRYLNCNSPIIWKTNGREYQALSYTNFCPSEPDCTNQSEQYCMTIVKDCWAQRNTYGWQDDACYQPRCPICEIVIV